MTAQSRASRVATKLLPAFSQRAFARDWADAGTDHKQLAKLAKRRRSLDGPRPPLRAWTKASTTVAGRPLHLLTPKSGSTGRVLFYCHGGAFVFGPSTFEWIHAVKFAAATGCDLALYDYPKVPEHDSAKTRAATLAAYSAIADRYDADQTTISGLSAGGGLAVSTMLQLHRDGHQLPNAAALFSPWLDLTVSHPEAATQATTDKMLPIEVLRHDGRLYAGAMGLANPLVSPRFMTSDDLAVLPPTVVTAGTHELFLPEAEELVNSLSAAGVRATLHLERFGQHAGIMGQTPEAAQVFAAAATQMRQHLAPAR